jgi:hypothetical protein
VGQQRRTIPVFTGIFYGIKLGRETCTEHFDFVQYLFLRTKS